MWSNLKIVTLQWITSRISDIIDDEYMNNFARNRSLLFFIPNLLLVKLIYYFYPDLWSFVWRRHVGFRLKTKLSEMIIIILKEILFFHRFPIYQQVKIKLFMFDKAWRKQDFANIQVPLKWNWAKYSWRSGDSQVDCLK